MQFILKLLLFLLLLSNSSSAAEWEKVTSKDGITLYEKKEEKFNFSQFKGEVLLEHPVHQIVNTIMRPLSYPLWLADCVYAKRLFTATLKVHMITQPPWPLEQRQVLLKVKKKSHDGFTMITLNSITPQYYFRKSNAIWFEFLNAQFTLVPISENQTIVRLELAAHPGGNIPQFLIDKTGWMIPYQSLRDLKSYIDKIHKKESL